MLSLCLSVCLSVCLFLSLCLSLLLLLLQYRLELLSVFHNMLSEVPLSDTAAVLARRARVCIRPSRSLTHAHTWTRVARVRHTTKSP
jgi:hypothetical protein